MWKQVKDVSKTRQMWEKSVSWVIINDEFIFKRSIIVLRELLFKTAPPVSGGSTQRPQRPMCCIVCGNVCLLTSQLSTTTDTRLETLCGQEPSLLCLRLSDLLLYLGQIGYSSYLCWNQGKILCSPCGASNFNFENITCAGKKKNKKQPSGSFHPQSLELWWTLQSRQTWVEE